jgi:hypothetical protein
MNPPLSHSANSNQNGNLVPGKAATKKHRSPTKSSNTIAPLAVGIAARVAEATGSKAQPQRTQSNYNKPKTNHQKQPVDAKPKPKRESHWARTKALALAGPDQTTDENTADWTSGWQNTNDVYDPNVLSSLRFPPESWESRDSFVDPDKSSTIRTWIESTEDPVGFSVNTERLVEHSDKIIAWRDWYRFPNGPSFQLLIEELDLDSFFEIYLVSRPLPEPEMVALYIPPSLGTPTRPARPFR